MYNTNLHTLLLKKYTGVPCGRFFYEFQNQSLLQLLNLRARIKKPVVAYDIVSYYKKAVCPNLFAALPNIFYHLNFTILIKHCRYHF
jgi:hypothetical protein